MFNRILSVLPPTTLLPKIWVIRGDRTDRIHLVRRLMVQLDGFGYKNAWLAVRGSTASELAVALGLAGLEPCDWSSGLHRAYDFGSGFVFITQPVDGWTLCVGTGLFRFADERNFHEIVPKLSKHLNTEVQYFSTHRVPEAHAWARATPEGLVRAYQFVGERGETLTDVGEPTSEENELGFHFFDERSPEADSDDYWSRDDLTFPDESHVTQLAGRWRVDPTGFEGREVEEAQGFLAMLPGPAYGSAHQVSGPKTEETHTPWWKFW